VTASAAADVMSGPAVDILFEQPSWHAVADAEGIIRRAIASAAQLVPALCSASPNVAGQGRGEGPEGAGTGVPDSELSVLLCGDDAIACLNARWRGHQGPTNVLSFPAPPSAAFLPPGSPTALGDIAIAYETVCREAAALGKPVGDHLAHMVVHGFLHLLGYDHEEDREAEQMERLEGDILARIGIADIRSDSRRRTEDG
jgi:probable rRNA maturation factor